MKINPLLATDFYKIGHPFQYPKGTQFIYSNLTPRKSRMPGVSEMVFFGLQYFVKDYLIRSFNENFFRRPKAEVMAEYKRRIRTSIGDIQSYAHIEALHDLQYLPLKIKALPEGSKVPMQVPCLTVQNTLPEFYWLTNFIESVMSAYIWQPCTSATIAYEYRKLLDKFAVETGMPPGFVQWQGHDFSFRGMSSLDSAVASGMGHLLSFTGTDTIPAIDALEQFYGAVCEKELIGASVPATEHSVMSANGEGNELDTFDRLISEVYPTGIVSIVSDTWDLWKVCTEYLPALKDKIMKRDGKVVVRPDSGDPVEILCGKYGFHGWGTPAQKGVVELLWEVFGGTVTSKGYKLLDPHIGAIYGDSITLERAEHICRRLEEKGFASQVVFGIGSFTYQHNTRDTFGTAMKATMAIIDEKEYPIYKSPVTDDGTKKSARGWLCVKKNEAGKYELKDNCSFIMEAQSDIEIVFNEGKLVKEQTLSQIRKTLHGA
jgi:nicotinamide phosphoribosyltransferase